MPQIRGLVTYAGTLYAVRGDGLFSIDSTGVTTRAATLNSAAGPVDFSSTVTQLVINDGGFLYAYTPFANTLEVAADYPGGDRIAFLDQRVFFMRRATQQFGWTALGNAAVVDPLAFASAERSPDLLVSIAAVAGELWLFGASSIEVWQSTGGADVVAAQRAAGIEYGCAAPFSVANISNSLMWLGRDDRGQAIVLKAAGYQPQRISTRAIEERFQGVDVSRARAFAYTEGGQQFYVLSCPGVDTSLVWDDTFGQWHERAEQVNGQFRPWRATTHAFAYGEHFVGTDDGDVFTMSKNLHSYGDTPKVRERISPVMSTTDRRGVNFAAFELVCRRATTGAVMMRFSNDNGANWSDWRTETAGQVGEYARRIKFHRLGNATDRVFQVRMTDNQPFHPVAAHVTTR